MFILKTYEYLSYNVKVSRKSLICKNSYYYLKFMNDMVLALINVLDIWNHIQL